MGGGAEAAEHLILMFVQENHPKFKKMPLLREPARKSAFVWFARTTPELRLRKSERRRRGWVLIITRVVFKRFIL